MSKLSPARKLALDVLMEADRRGMYARDVLSSRASAKAIDQRDSAFAARLAPLKVHAPPKPMNSPCFASHTASSALPE